MVGKGKMLFLNWVLRQSIPIGPNNSSSQTYYSAYDSCNSTDTDPRNIKKQCNFKISKKECV